MTDTQTRKLNMGIAVEDGLKSEPFDAIITASALATAKRDELEQNIGDIEEADEAQQATSSGGEAISKEEAKHNMADAADLIAQGICGYALDHNDHVLYEQMNLRAPTIVRLKDTDCTAFCMLVLNKANEDPAGLLPYNVTSGMLTAFPLLIQAFGDADGIPRDAQGLHHTATTNVSLGIVAMLKTLLWFDHWVGTLRTTNHDFYTAYRTWRKIVKTGVRHMSIRGLVKDSITATPLYKAKITVLETGGVSYSGKTGKFRIMSLNPNVFTLTIELHGFQKTTVSNVSVLEGKITDVPVTLVKNV